IFLEEMIEQVLQRRRNAVIVFPADNDKAIRGAIGFGQRFQDRRRLALFVLLEHAVEERQPFFERVDKRGCMTTPGELIDDKAGGLDALPRLTDRSVEDNEIERHGNPSSSWRPWSACTHYL